MAMDVNQAVDIEQGLIGRQIFIDPEIYAQELEQIFARCWLFLCHESQIPHPGDFFLTYIGEDRVIVVRDKDGATMRTEVMFYNQVRNEVSSDKSFVWDEPGRHVEGDGFTSDPEFRKITATRPHGTGGQVILPNQ